MNTTGLLAITLTGLWLAGTGMAQASDGEWSGNINLEARLFPHDALDRRQHEHNLSLSVQPEYYRSWNNGDDSFTFVPFLRIDQGDEDRTHADIRELTWLHAAEDWELRVGIRKLFWGVTESQHLVDIINQTDLIENPDQEEKLGQPMLNLALIRDWGTLDLYVLPGFRERSFPGIDGRLRSQPYVDTDQARYESGAGDKHVDVALRWTRSLGDWDIGLSHFHGTGRDPLLLPGLDAAGRPTLIPFYAQIDQTGLDLQTTLADWLWKLEVITRDTLDDRHTALTGGFEYTFVGIFDTDADLGLISEYLFDDRGDSAPTPFQDDIMAGLRLSLNDAQSTEALMGVIADRRNGTRSFNLEASRRLGADFKLNVEARFFSHVDSRDPVAGLRDDDYVELSLGWYF